MKVSVKLYTNKETKQGFPVTVFFRSPTIRKRVSLGWYFKLDDWDFEKQMPIPAADDFDFVYPKLLNFRSEIKNLLFKGETNIDAFLAIFNNTTTTTLSFYKFGENLAAEMRVKGLEGNAKVYEIAINQFKKVRKTLLFSELNYNTLKEFKLVKQNEGRLNSTIHHYLRTFKSIYNEAVRLKIVEDTQPFKDIFLDVTVRKNRTKKKYLTIKGIRKLENLTNLPKGQQLARDLFLLQFYFGGQDLIDVYNLTTDQLKNGRVYFFRSKLGERGYEFDLKIIDKAAGILKKYKPVNGVLFPGRKDFKGYENFRRRYQKNLIILQQKGNIKVKPKNENLAVKVARYTFANLGKLNGIDEDMLRELMGHERTDVDTIYKDKHPQKKRDKAHLKIVTTN